MIDIDALVAAVFRETSSIGVRYYPGRAPRAGADVTKVRLLGEPVGIKIADVGGEPVNVQPEYDDCLAVARKKRLPLKDVLRRALEDYSKKG